MDNPFKKLAEEWKKASPKEKLMIVGAAASIVGIALYLHSKTSSSAPGTGLAGLPSNLSTPASTGGTGSTGITGTTSTGTPTDPGDTGLLAPPYSGVPGIYNPTPTYGPTPTPAQQPILAPTNASKGTLQMANLPPLQTALLNGIASPSNIIPPSPNPGKITNPNTGATVQPVRSNYVPPQPTTLTATYASIQHAAAPAPVKTLQAAAPPAPAQVVKKATAF